MSKSILLSNSLERAINAETNLELGDDILNTLWSGVRDMAQHCPVMWRIVQDFYGDFRVEPSELQSLSGEIQHMVEYFANQSEVVIWLEVLRALSRMGIRYNLALFGIAD